ncbi:hypothetical protein PPERSA_08125 [Pseudocohnilembus persalinus]|uniref:Palmitoyltransferase n=1 Tax=Pseudocohnilembus persalinus TaxID=266149 RepID=A0A0V0QLK1_PSEPJ|nr:hypothetical protein PPERSA_08125 [Pseudocohnilembus persalinus]|eukprot:KRX03050.1 hypothetical protein PPERSA_08125 [Pseudocohnilembus persalinus]
MQQFNNHNLHGASNYEYEDRKVKKNGFYTPLNDATRFCTVCSSYVQEKTKHCGSCNRCVHKFDHHCNENIALIFNCINVVVDPFAIAFIVDLAFYHLWLRLKKITTYEHILQKRAIKEQRELEKERIKFQKERQKIQNQIQNSPFFKNNAQADQPAQNEYENSDINTQNDMNNSQQSDNQEKSKVQEQSIQNAGQITQISDILNTQKSNNVIEFSEPSELNRTSTQNIQLQTNQKKNVQKNIQQKVLNKYENKDDILQIISNENEQN